jgi:hypothetical protein
MPIICTLLIFDGEFFCNLYFNITMTSFLNPHFSFYLSNKCIAIFSKVHCQFDMKIMDSQWIIHDI